jgi:eukaryotic-like serine/threonine-protein kinase
MRNRRSPARRTRVGQEVAGPRVVEEDEYVPSRRPRLPEIWPWLLLLLLLVIGGLSAAYFLTRDDDNKKSSASAVTVPAVVGLKESKVVKQLDERGLVPQLATGPSKFPAGTVFAQDPGAGTSLNRGSLVKVSVSSAAQISVPNVVGSTTSVAVSRLKAAGLQSQVTTVPATAAAGVVVKETTPVAGTKVAKGSTVALRASKGETTVPDVRGQPASDAKAALQTAGLVPVEFKVPSAQPKGTVTAQNPLPNKKVPRGSKVRVNVSTGSASTPGTTTSGTTTTA